MKRIHDYCFYLSYAFVLLGLGGFSAMVWIDQESLFSLRRLTILLSCLTIGAISFVMVFLAASWIALTGWIASKGDGQHPTLKESGLDVASGELQRDPALLGVGLFMAVTWLLAMSGLFLFPQ